MIRRTLTWLDAHLLPVTLSFTLGWLSATAMKMLRLETALAEFQSHQHSQDAQITQALEVANAARQQVERDQRWMEALVTSIDPNVDKKFRRTAPAHK